MNLTSRRLKTGFVISTALALVQAVPALAQEEADASEAVNVNDIIVTARRSEERLQVVPISITVFNQEQLSNRNITNAEDLAIYTPSLSQNNTLGSTTSSYAIRGFVQDIGTQASVGVYFADVVAPLAASAQQAAGNGAGPGSFFDLQNVQVLKGPQGTLFGRNTTGGAVLLVPRRPTDKFEGYVEGSIGNYDLRRVQAVLNVPLAETFKVRFGVDRQKRDGYLKNYSGIGPSAYYDSDYTALRVSVVGDLTPNLENYIVATYTKVDQTGDPLKVFAANPNDAAAGSPLAIFGIEQLRRLNAAGRGFYATEVNLPESFVKQETWQVINTTTWRASDTLTVKNIASYAQLTSDFKAPVFGLAPNAAEINAYLPLPFPFFAPGQLETVGNQSAPGAKTTQQSTFTEELQLQGTAFDDRLNFQAGAYLSISNPLGTAGVYSTILMDCPVEQTVCANPIRFLAQLANPAANSPFASTNVSKTSFDTKAVYAQATYALSDQFKLTGGLRYTWDKVSSKGKQQNFLYAAIPTGALPPFAFIAAPPTGVVCASPDLVEPDCAIAATQKSDAPTWLVGLDYTPTRNILLYAKWARGYRSGGVSLQAPPAYRTFSPEKVEAYELGLKTSFQGAVNGTFNVAGFYNTFSDQQLVLAFTRAGTAVGSTGIQNAGRSRIYGLEVDTSISPFRGFVVSGGYTYLNTKVKSIVAPAASPGVMIFSQILPGDPLTFSPNHKFSFTGAYTLPLDSNVGEVTLSATYSYQSKALTGYSRRDAAGNVIVPSGTPERGLLDLNLNWRDVGGLPIDLALFANNVTKKKYYNITLDNFNIPGQGITVGSPGLPRMYGMRLRYRFAQ